MKKIFALLLSFSVAGIAMAQNSKIEEARRIIKGGDTRTTEERRGVYGDDDRVYDNESREARVDRINREYNAKIQAVRNNRFLSAAQKERKIRELQAERNRQIREVNGTYGRTQDRRYEDRRNDRRYDDDDRYEKEKKNKNKGNNGKHLGWEKGKGNPHKGRG